MFKLTIAILFTFTSFVGFAAELTYEADYSQMKNMDSVSLDICGIPEKVTMGASEPLGPTFISKLYSWGKVTSERIQATDGSVSGGSLAPEFSGNYREKVYIVKQELENLYEPGIFNRVQVNTYGSTSAPSGVILNVELLNHRYSAELAEGNFCGDVYYKLKK